jgi:hypothetical protein
MLFWHLRKAVMIAKEVDEFAIKALPREAIASNSFGKPKAAKKKKSSGI